MQVKLTIGERLKDLRVEQKLTLEQLAAEVGISKSALGKYESDNGKDISPYSILLLADYYGVSCDYLMGRTETKNHPNTALHELHLSDASIDVLRTGKFNHRLLSELICHKDFQRFMLDAEIYVDRIADMRVNDMNAVLEAVRQMALMKNGGEENDLHLRTLEVAQIREDEYFGSLIADDLKGILRDIRSEHRLRTVGFCCSKILRLCHLGVTKSACPTAARKRLLPHSAAPQSMPPTPFPRQPEAKV